MPLLAALGALLAFLVWWRFLRRPVVRGTGYRINRRALSRAELNRPVFPPAERWRGEARGFRDDWGKPLWAPA